mmetsp:Transcript_15980/g.30407  ORF Transcript_15980/g.30407 Transcript_15980/m.30407 type:complete len:184 (-) Transcript_15980:217-768(-)
MANSHLCLSGGSRLKHDKFYPLKRTSTHNADWGSSSSASSSSTEKVVLPSHCHSKEPSSWPLSITLKHSTRQSLLQEFGLKDRGMPPTSSGGSRSNNNFKPRSQASLSLMRKNASRLSSLSSTKNLLELPVGVGQTGSTKNLLSPDCGLRRSCHLGTRRATVASLQPMSRASIFRQAIKQQQS